jgi:hypothetical protein
MIALMKRQLYLAHWYYHHNPETILSGTSVDAAMAALLPAFMGGVYPDGNTSADAKLKRNVTTSHILLRICSRSPLCSHPLSCRINWLMMGTDSTIQLEPDFKDQEGGS